MKYTRPHKSACFRAHGISHKSLVFVLFAMLAVGVGLALFEGPRAAAVGKRTEAPISAASASSVPDLLWMQGGHAGGSGKAALSADGRILATADYAEIYLWHYADGQLFGTLNATWIDSVKSIKFTPDGQHVVAGGTWIPGSPNASTLRMWRIADRSLVREFAVTWDVKSIAISADGKLLAAAVGGGDPSVVLFDVATGARVRTLGHFAANAVAFSRDGFVAAAGADEFGAPPTVPVWRASDGLQVAKLAGLSFITDAVAFSPDGRYLAAGDWGGNGTTPKILVWLAPAFLPVQTLSPYAGSGGQIAFTPDSQTIAGYGAAGAITLWHLPDGLQTGAIPVNINAAVWNIIFSDNDTLFASGAQDTAEVRRVSDGALLRTIGSNREFVTSSVFSPDGAHYVGRRARAHARHPQRPRQRGRLRARRDARRLGLRLAAARHARHAHPYLARRERPRANHHARPRGRDALALLLARRADARLKRTRQRRQDLAHLRRRAHSHHQRTRELGPLGRLLARRAMDCLGERRLEGEDLARVGRHARADDTRQRLSRRLHRVLARRADHRPDGERRRPALAHVGRRAAADDVRRGGLHQHEQPRLLEGRGRRRRRQRQLRADHLVLAHVGRRAVEDLQPRDRLGAAAVARALARQHNARHRPLRLGGRGGPLRVRERGLINAYTDTYGDTDTNTNAGTDSDSGADSDSDSDT